MIQATYVTRRDPVVFVIDGDPLIHSGIARLAEQMNLRCEAFTSGMQFLGAAVDENVAGCVVSEVRIPDMAGLQLQNRLITAGCTLPVVFHTAHPSIELAVQAVRNGAVDFLEKPFKEQRVWEAIQRALQLDRARWRRKLRNLELRRQIAGITNRELNIMVQVTEGKKNHEIARDEGIALRTVEKLRAQLMRKVGATTLQDLIRFQLVAQCQLTDHCHSEDHCSSCQTVDIWSQRELMPIVDPMLRSMRG